MSALLQRLSYFLVCTALLAGCAGESEPDRPWVGSIRNELGYLGARNWVVIAEAAFPVHSRRGLKVIQVDEDIPEVLKGLEEVIEEKHHVKPRVYVTTEIGEIPYDYTLAFL